jgi:hypothetical protein
MMDPDPHCGSTTLDYGGTQQQIERKPSVHLSFKKDGKDGKGMACPKREKKILHAGKGERVDNSHASSSPF